MTVKIAAAPLFGIEFSSDVQNENITNEEKCVFLFCFLESRARNKNERKEKNVKPGQRPIRVSAGIRFDLTPPRGWDVKYVEYVISRDLFVDSFARIARLDDGLTAITIIRYCAAFPGSF